MYPHFSADLSSILWEPLVQMNICVKIDELRWTLHTVWLLPCFCDFGCLQAWLLWSVCWN